MKAQNKLTAVIIFVLKLASAVGCAATVTFDQLHYEASGVDQSSDWGQANILFDAGDLNLFMQNPDGSYLAYVNIVTTVAGGWLNNWAVQNLPMYFSSTSAYLNQTADGVWFSLGTGSGPAVSALNYSMSVSASPVAAAPVLALAPVSVTSRGTGEYGIVPDANGQVVADGWASFFASPAFNFVGVLAGNSLLSGGASGMDDNTVPTLDAQAGTCGAASAARSLAKLKVADAQTAYDKLKPVLYPDGKPPVTDSWKKFFIDAKKSKYPGVTTIWDDNINEIIKQLKAGADVEWWFEWSGLGTNKGGAHQVFVNDIQPTEDGYLITGFDNSGKHPWKLKKDGSWSGDVPGGGAAGTTASDGFFVETIPEPSAGVILLLGLSYFIPRRRATKA